jgi:two-component system OmpR family response regulator
MIEGMRLIVVDDEVSIRDLLARGLGEAGYVVDTAGSGADALHLLRMYEYAIAVIDWRMPDMSGVDVIRAARASHRELPVLMLTARDGLRDRVEGLDAGADDYLVKPFEFDELLARLRALLRRPLRGPLKTFEFGDLVLDQATRRASVRGRTVELSPKELTILELLMSRVPATVSTREIGLHAWEDDTELVGSNTIHVHIGRLRHKLTGANVRLVTVRGQGIRLEAGQ